MFTNCIYHYANEHGEVINVLSRDTNAVSRTGVQHLVPLKTLIRTKHQSDGACYSVSANLICPLNYHGNILCLGKKSVMAKGCRFSLYASKFILVSNHNRVPSNRGIFEFRSDQSKM
jgi:hypothetical protein